MPLCDVCVMCASVCDMCLCVMCASVCYMCLCVMCVPMMCVALLQHVCVPPCDVCASV